MKRAAIYTRVSSEEQIDGYSLSAQEVETRRVCELKGWEVGRVYSDPGRSGRTAIRPGFQAMINDAEQGQFDVIVVHKLDRFSRSLLDTLSYLGRLDKTDVSFISATEDFDFTTPLGKLMLYMLGAFAEWYVNNLAAETRKGKKQRAKSGGWNGTLSFGYMTKNMIRTELERLGKEFEAGNLSQELYSQEADWLERTFEYGRDAHDTMAIPHVHYRSGALLAYTLYATGNYGDTDVAWELNNAGFRTTGNHGRNLFSKDTVTWMLQNRFYLGEVSYRKDAKGKKGGKYNRDWMPGEHEAIISKELFDTVQKVRSWKARERTTSTVRSDVQAYPLSGLLVCAECGSNYRGWNMRGERRYRDPAKDLGKACHQTPKSSKAEKFEGQITEILELLKLQVPDDWRRIALKKLQHETPGQLLQDQNRRRDIEVKLQRARDLYLMGDIEGAEYRSMRDNLQSKMTVGEAPVNVVDLERVSDLLGNIDVLWTKASPEERKKLLRELFATIYVENGGIVALEAQPILWELKNLDIKQKGTTKTSEGDTYCGSDGRRSLAGSRQVLVFVIDDSCGETLHRRVA
ncbi:recombinase family protein [Chloroflexota bacterium]